MMDAVGVIESCRICRVSATGKRLSLEGCLIACSMYSSFQSIPIKVNVLYGEVVRFWEGPLLEAPLYTHYTNSVSSRLTLALEPSSTPGIVFVHHKYTPEIHQASKCRFMHLLKG